MKVQTNHSRVEGRKSRRLALWTAVGLSIAGLSLIEDRSLLSAEFSGDPAMSRAFAKGMLDAKGGLPREYAALSLPGAALGDGPGSPRRSRLIERGPEAENAAPALASDAPAALGSTPSDVLGNPISTVPGADGPGSFFPFPGGGSGGGGGTTIGDPITPPGTPTIPPSPPPVSPVPEPASWMMMIFGFGAIGTMLRKRGSANRVQSSPASNQSPDLVK